MSIPPSPKVTEPAVAAPAEPTPPVDTNRIAEAAEEDAPVSTGNSRVDAILRARREHPSPDPALVERANNGDIAAQREVGEFYGKQWRFEESNQWYRQAADAGDTKAQYIMGVRYTFGQGVEVDPAEAGKWYLMAAEQGHAQSQYSVGLRWARGEAGEPKDLTEASKWFRLAADQGLGTAQLSLARRYIEGGGVEQDYIEAYKWLWLCRTNTPGATKLIKEITPKMAPEQIKLAKQMAAGFVPKAPEPIRR